MGRGPFVWQLSQISAATYLAAPDQATGIAAAFITRRAGPGEAGGLSPRRDTKEKEMRKFVLMFLAVAVLSIGGLVGTAQADHGYYGGYGRYGGYGGCGYGGYGGGPVYRSYRPLYYGGGYGGHHHGHYHGHHHHGGGIGLYFGF
jgi:hypothetical protein